MAVKNFVEKNKYYDSVFLMKLAKYLTDIEGVDNALVGMGTPLNKETMKDMNLLCEEGENATNDDLIIAVSATSDELCLEAKNAFLKLIEEKNKNTGEIKYQSIQGVLNAKDDVNLAVISVAGEYAVEEAKRALLNGLNVFMFSDNVPVEDEVMLKNIALEKGLFMMGPGCGLSFINGVAIGLCSMVRRGDIGIVGASGSGIQEVMVLVHKYGLGISHAIGTGGRDLSDEVGGITMIQGIKALEEDQGTKVIALISKPPAYSALLKVMDVIKKCKKPVVVQFINGDNSVLAENGITYTETFEDTAKKVIELSTGNKIESLFNENFDDVIKEELSKYSAAQKYFRAILCGGSLADEAQIIWAKKSGKLYSNVAFNKELMLENPFESFENTIIDIGDEIFTNGRAHVAIDPTARVNRFIKEARDKETAVIYLDFLLGYALHPDPAAVMAEAIKNEKELAKNEGRNLTVIATICGSDVDPQGYDDQKQKLIDAGVIIAETNEGAVNIGIEIINNLEGK